MFMFYKTMSYFSIYYNTINERKEFTTFIEIQKYIKI